MKISRLIPGEVIKSKNTNHYGIITCVNWDPLCNSDRYPYIEMLWETGEFTHGFFICWLEDPDYDGLEFTEIMVPIEKLHILTKNNVKEIIDGVISR